MFWQTQTSYEFGPFRVDARERQLLRGEEVIPLTPKVFDILLMLLQNSGHIVSKDDVMKVVWSNAVVEEGNVARNISTLRSALGEHPREHRYIETIPWRGYRFVANVRELHDQHRGPSIESIAVMPFVNVNANANDKNEYLTDGITESLITDLAQLTNLRVISRNSAFRYKGREINAKTIGRELNVQALVMGRVTESSDMLSISVELLDTNEDRHVWGAQYLRKPDDLFELPKTIARKIVEVIGLPTHGQPVRTEAHTQNHEAYLCYLKGRYYFNKLTLEGVQKAIEYLLQAIEQDSNYALAYAALGDCHSYLAHRDEARSAVVKALELDETLGEAHASLGFFSFLYHWDFTEAEKEFKKAIALSPNYAEAHHWYAIYLANLGRHQEAEQQAKQAVELDPLSLLMNMTPALNLFLARQYDQAIEQLQKILDMEPSFIAARSVMGIVMILKGRCNEAMSEYRKVLELIKGTPTVEVSVKAIMAQGHARCGELSEAQKLLEEVLAAGSGSPYSIAGIYSALGESDAAFEFLERALDQHDPQMVSLKVDPSLDGVRFDPRFEKLLNRVGLPT